MFVRDNLGENWALNTDSLRNPTLKYCAMLDEININHLSKP